MKNLLVLLMFLGGSHALVNTAYTCDMQAEELKGMNVVIELTDKPGEALVTATADGEVMADREKCDVLATSVGKKLKRQVLSVICTEHEADAIITINFLVDGKDSTLTATHTMLDDKGNKIGSEVFLDNLPMTCKVLPKLEE